MKFPRNSPCLCGSGKKFKNCCDVDESRPEHPPDRKTDHFIDEPVPEAGPIPVFSKKFFLDLDPDDKICVYLLLYSSMLRPKVDRLASEPSNRLLRRGRSEAGRIRACRSTAELIGMMKTGLDPLNHVLMRKRLLEKPDESVPQLMAELRNPSTDGFAELAVRILAGAKMDGSGDLMDIISRRDKSVYQLAIMCILPGFFDNPNRVPFLWNHYCCFRSKFPHEKYWKGPFYGMWETWARGVYGKLPSSD